MAFVHAASAGQRRPIGHETGSGQTIGGMDLRRPASARRAAAPMTCHCTPRSSIQPAALWPAPSCRRVSAYAWQRIAQCFHPRQRRLPRSKRPQNEVFKSLILTGFGPARVSCNRPNRPITITAYCMARTWTPAFPSPNIAAPPVCVWSRQVQVRQNIRLTCSPIPVQTVPRTAGRGPGLPRQVLLRCGSSAGAPQPARRTTVPKPSCGRAGLWKGLLP